MAGGPSAAMEGQIGMECGRNVSRRREIGGLKKGWGDYQSVGAKHLQTRARHAQRKVCFLVFSRNIPPLGDTTFSGPRAGRRWD